MFPVDRNVRFVVTLFFAMTLGAATLRWMEAPPRQWSKNTLLMAESNETYNDLTIEVIPAAQDDGDHSSYDCVIPPDERVKPAWFEPRPANLNLRMLVLDDGSGSLTKYQAENVLKVLGNMRLHGQLTFENVYLDPDSDPRLNPSAPGAAQDLLALLVRKDVVR